MTTPTVVEMPNTFVSEDGNFVQMDFKLSDNSITKLSFSLDDMMAFIGRTFELFLNKHLKSVQEKGHYKIVPLKTIGSMADAPIGGKAIIFNFRLKSGIPVAFEVTLKEADDLKHQLGMAVKKAREHASKSRH